jgi:predicted Mrr-cat superfamily restriction endonuclease
MDKRGGGIEIIPDQSERVSGRFRTRCSDLMVLPLKTQPAAYISAITGPNAPIGRAGHLFFHWRAVKWMGGAIPRNHAAQRVSARA